MAIINCCHHRKGRGKRDSTMIIMILTYKSHQRVVQTEDQVQNHRQEKIISLKLKTMIALYASVTLSILSWFLVVMHAYVRNVGNISRIYVLFVESL